jgi:hypothetical protein
MALESLIFLIVKPKVKVGYHEMNNQQNDMEDTGL